MKLYGEWGIKLKRIKINSVKLELVLALFISATLTGIIILFLCYLLILGSANHDFAVFFFKHLFAFVFSFLILSVVLIITFFLLIIKKNVEYLEAITDNLRKISKGNLDINIPVKSQDELGIMAQTVNEMAVQLKNAIEEERRLEKTKSDLITNISHDLRTPLTSILGYLELINSTELKEEELLKKYSGIARNQGMDLKIRIDELFDYTKLSDKDFNIQKTKISLKELIEQILIGFIPAFEDADMEYQMFFCEEKIFINADAFLLTRVFDNLVSNALKYGNSGKQVDIKLQKESKVAVVQVISYGNQIPKEELPYIFEKFYKIDKSRTSLSENTSSGLGLAIVKRIVEIHEGSILAESSINETIFEVKLPLL